MFKKKNVVIGLIATAIVCTLGFITVKSDLYFEISKNIELFGKVYKEISFNYVDEVDPQEFMRAGIKGMLSKLDPYTVFIDEKNQDEVDLLTNGKYGGVGVSIGVRNDKITILELIDGYAAQKQGMMIGDVITEVDNRKVTPEDIDDISSMVKGEPGSTVQIKILRNSEPDTLTFNLVREEVIIKNLLYADFYPENSNNVYLKLANFSRSAGDELRSALRQLREKKEIKSIVLDLRGNPGGLLDVAVDICDKFLKKDLLIVSTKGKDPKSEKKYFSVEEPMAGNENLVVLINGSSASASEIVAGAMQDHDRGIIVGTQSFGKGLVQTIIPLSFNTSLKVTTAKYYTPSGRCIQKIDYSKGSRVISEENPLTADKFKTDNDREVFSAGGISPDTTVEMTDGNELVKDLLAKGVFFNFANGYYFKNQNAVVSKIKDKELFSEFKKFLSSSDYKYQSDVQKKINEIVKSIKEKNDSDKLFALANKLQEECSTMFDDELDKSKDQILTELKIELMHRFSGAVAGITEKLKYDKQFLTALEILKDQKKYNRFINIKN